MSTARGGPILVFCVPSLCVCFVFAAVVAISSHLTTTACQMDTPRLVAACLTSILFVAGLQAAQAMLMEGPEGLRSVPGNLLLLLQARTKHDTVRESLMHATAPAVAVLICLPARLVAHRSSIPHAAAAAAVRACLPAWWLTTQVIPHAAVVLTRSLNRSPPINPPHLPPTNRGCASPSSRPGRRWWNSTARTSGAA